MTFVRLIPIGAGLRRILAVSTEEFETTYGAALGGNAGLAREVVDRTLALYERSPRAPIWGGYLAAVAADDDRPVVVGTCGYAHGPDAAGAVEIAYFTFPPFEGRGHASAMARVLVDLARGSRSVREIVAHTRPEKNASTRILEKVGLRHVGEAPDPDIGTAWRWSSGPVAPRAAGAEPARASLKPVPIKPAVSLGALEALDIRVGTIVAVEDIPKSKKVVRLTVDFGDHRRRILAGLKQERADPCEIQGRQCLFVVNLEPRTILGEVSEGMLFDVGSADGITPCLAVPERPVPDGARAG